MNMPFKRSKSMPERALQTIAGGAGMVRLAIRQRTMRPHIAHSRNRHGVRGMLRG
jgi:hypothetical protein